MNVKKQHIVLIIIAALFVGFLGGYIGYKTMDPNESAKQQTTDDGSENNDAQQNENDENSETNNDENSETNNDSNDAEDDVPEYMSKVVQAYGLIKENYVEDVEEDDLIEGAIQGMLETLDDPYSEYMDIETVGQFNEQLESSFEGIGAEVSMVDGKVTIIAPIKDSPAEEASLRPNDQIISIDQEDIDGLDLQEAVDKIRGEKGSEVTLEIERPGVKDTFEVTLVRDEIPVETVYSELESIDGHQTGYLEITSFSEETAEEFAEELEALENEGIEGLTIDVRGNPGGYLEAVEDILANFVPKDIPYMQIENKEGEKQPFYSTLDEKKSYPINILVDEGSASASEILAVALQELEYDVVGKTSYGKGTVQQAVPLGDGSTIKLTIYRWLSPNGVSINETGVEPTVEKEQPDYYYSHPIRVEDDSYKLDDTDEQIENIQIILNGLGYETDRVDGHFDETTEKAVTDFQEDEDLDVTGEVNEETGGHLESMIIEKIRNGEDDEQLEEAFKSLYK